MDPVNDQLFVECGMFFTFFPFNSTYIVVYTPYSVEKTLDSSRYFVLVPTDERGRRAFIGLGFQERSESFDFEQALLSYDRFQSSKKEIEIMQKDWEENKQDLSLKEGEKIKINFGNKFSKKDKSTQDEDSSNFSMLLPPPGDVKKGPQEKEGSNISMLLPPPPGDNVTGSLNNSSGDFFQQSGEWSSFDTSNNDSEEWTQF